MKRKYDYVPYDDPVDPEKEERADRPELELTRQEKRWVALGALKGALLIGLAYLIGGAALIWLMLALWT